MENALGELQNPGFVLGQSSSVVHVELLGLLAKLAHRNRGRVVSDSYVGASTVVVPRW